MTEQEKRGRPKKEVKGQMVWIPDIYVEPIKAFLNALKKHSQPTAQRINDNHTV